jgi:hypothetical protein
MITPIEEPNIINGSLTNLLYNVSSSNADKPQFRYLVDIYQDPDNDNPIASFKTFPNQYGRGIFDIARIVNDKMEYDINYDISGSSISTKALKVFNVKIGEEYGTTQYSNVTQYPDLYEGDNFFIIPAAIEPSSLSYDLQDRAFLTNTSFGSQNNPVPISVNDYQTLSGFRESNLNTITYTVYNGSTVLATVNYTAVLPLYNHNLYTVGVGPKNLSQLDSNLATALAGTWDRIRIRLTYDDASRPLYWLANTQYCNPYTRFAFINKYGVLDYYNVESPIDKKTKLERKTFDKSQVNYSGTSVAFRPQARGTTQYHLSSEDTYKITTEYLDQGTSDWLIELFESPEVFVQEGDNLIPINITSANYTWKTNPYSQKLFQYDFEYKYSNNRRSIY